MKKNKWHISFFKFQSAAIIATAIDFSILIFLTEVFGIWYVYSTLLGALAGAIVNFNLCRYWAFTNAQNKFKHQVYRYALISLGSLIFNSSFVFILTETIHINYTISKIITAAVIAIFYNYTLQKYFVFK